MPLSWYVPPCVSRLHRTTAMPTMAFAAPAEISETHPMTDLHIEDTYEFGQDTGQGNLLGIQPYMVSADYASEETFYARLDGCMQAANQKHWLNERTIAV